MNVALAGVPKSQSNQAIESNVPTHAPSTLTVATGVGVSVVGVGEGVGGGVDEGVGGGPAIVFESLQAAETKASAVTNAKTGPQ